MREPIMISRDPFARESIYRTCNYIYNGTHQKITCDFCGCEGKRVKGNYTRLFVYSVVPDTGRVNYIKGNFCSVQCMKGYHQ